MSLADELKVGDKVFNKKYYLGTVVGITPARHDIKVKLESNDQSVYVYDKDGREKVNEIRPYIDRIRKLTSENIAEVNLTRKRMKLRKLLEKLDVNTLPEESIDTMLKALKEAKNDR